LHEDVLDSVIPAAKRSHNADSAHVQI